MMKTSELSREIFETAIPRQGDAHEVIVAGGGPAVIGAATGAALKSAKTLLLEELISTGWWKL